jgi:hypothetical protein
MTVLESGVEKILQLLPETEPRLLGLPADNLITIPTTL